MRLPEVSSSNATVLSLNPEHYLPAPRVLGIPGFDSWRPWQESSILTSMEAVTRCVIECLPTGAGKTLIYGTEAVMSGGKVVILTSTKNQQDQITGKNGFKALVDAGLIADIRGQINYRCEAVMPGGEFSYMNPRGGWTPVADGPCQDGATCGLKEYGCGYYDALREARKRPIVVANYAMWMQNAMMEPRWWVIPAGSRPDLMILDEAHEAVDEVCGFMAAEITEKHEITVDRALGVRLPELTHDVAMWKEWGRWVVTRCDAWIEENRFSSGATTIRKEVKKLQREAEKIAGMAEDNWIVQVANDPRKDGYVVKFDPIWPWKAAEGLLLRGAKKVVMSSATVGIKDAQLLGFEDQDITFFEAPSCFPVENRPIYHIPCMQMNNRTENAEDGRGGDPWCEMMERLWQDRQDRNGLIHTTSYKRRNVLRTWAEDHSPQFARMILSHQASSFDVRAAVDRLRSELGLVLASPSLTTGYDFKYLMAEWQGIVKVPMPDRRVKVVEARCKQDKEYGPNVAAKTIMQATGRIDRAEDDVGETFITDDNIRWFLREWGWMMRGWWMEAYQDWGRTLEWKKGQLPKPIRRIRTV